jgi:hypothetical protein
MESMEHIERIGQGDMELMETMEQGGHGSDRGSTWLMM